MSVQNCLQFCYINHLNQVKFCQTIKNKDKRKKYILGQFLVVSLSLDNDVIATSKRCVKLYSCVINYLIYLFIYFDSATVAPVDSSNECSPSPCQNSGTCINRYNDYLCVCKRGYSGKNCETGKHAYGFLYEGGEGDPVTRKIQVSGFTCRSFGPCGHQVEEELKTCNFVRNRQFFASW